MNRAAAIYRRHHRLPKGAMLTHGNLTAAVSIYDVWGSHARRARPMRSSV